MTRTVVAARAGLVHVIDEWPRLSRARKLKRLGKDREGQIACVLV